jgi:hypothetical protein
MKVAKSLAAVITGIVTFSALTALADSWTPTTGSCTQSTTCYNGQKQVRTGSQTWCVSGGASSCTLTDCSYGPWQTQSC